MQPLRRVIREVGSQAEVAKALGVSPQAIHNWLTRSGRIPVKHVLRLAEITGMEPWEIRPDIYPKA